MRWRSRWANLARLTGVAVVLGAILTVASSSAALADGGPILSTAANQLEQHPPVYVDPNATQPILSNAQISHLSALITAGPHPIYLAILPAAVMSEVTSNDPAQIPHELYNLMHLSGVYAVWVGGAFRAGETYSAGVSATDLATLAYQSHIAKGDYAVLVNFIQRVEAQPVGEGTVTESHPSHTWEWVIGIILILAIIAGASWSLARRRKTTTDVGEQVHDKRARLQSQLQELQDEINATELTRPMARTKQATALDQCQSALAQLELAKTLRSVGTAEALLTDARASWQEAQRLEKAGQTS